MNAETFITMGWVPGKIFYTNEQIRSILEFNEITFNRVCVGMILKRSGFRSISKKIKGKTYRGFFIDHVRSKEEILALLSEKKNEDVKYVELSADEAHRVVRYLLSIWKKIPVKTQREYKLNRDRYFTEFETGLKISSHWFDFFIDDLHMLRPANHVDIVFFTLRDILFIEDIDRNIGIDRIYVLIKRLGYEEVYHDIFYRKIGNR